MLEWIVGSGGIKPLTACWKSMATQELLLSSYRDKGITTTCDNTLACIEWRWEEELVMDLCRYSESLVSVGTTDPVADPEGMTATFSFSYQPPITAITAKHHFQNITSISLNCPNAIVCISEIFPEEETPGTHSR